MKIFLNILIITILSINLSSADELQVFDFTETELTELKVRKVRGADNKTLYTVGSNDNGNYLKSVADNAASGLGKEIKINLNKTPFINITWKIEKDLSGIKENTKKGHDFAARVFVIIITKTLAAKSCPFFVFSLIPDRSFSIFHVIFINGVLLRFILISFPRPEAALSATDFK